ncbi:hypothetical protein GJ629_15295 [Halapricum sp. CBA1109]|uniref:hypothetical protein n=1 Tax=Halapricum sp. CBA1109 TaxID=2668068 RepID=UPI0012FBFD95|nr:hypothetical protein [Halapricum sp. CBA1109]MUV91084.1 hypothetical protein [Halapricum sp. CBA1109]
MNTRRLLVLVAVVGMVALAGCSTGDTTTTAADTPTDTATPEADETADTDTPRRDAGTGSASNGTEAGDTEQRVQRPVHEQRYRDR